jgi:hypothetical protein
MHATRHPSPLPPSLRVVAAGSPLPPDSVKSGEGSPLRPDPDPIAASGPHRASRPSQRQPVAQRPHVTSVALSRHIGHKLVQHSRKAVQLDEVGRSELVEYALALAGEPYPDQARVPCIRCSPDKAGLLSPVHEFDCAVMAQQQVTSQVADSGRIAARMSLDCDQQLVLDVGQARRARLVLAPPLEPAQANAEGQKSLEVRAGQLVLRASVIHPAPSNLLARAGRPAAALIAAAPTALSLCRIKIGPP